MYAAYHAAVGDAAVAAFRDSFVAFNNSFVDAILSSPHQPRKAVRFRWMFQHKYIFFYKLNSIIQTIN